MIADYFYELSLTGNMMFIALFLGIISAIGILYLVYCLFTKKKNLISISLSIVIIFLSLTIIVPYLFYIETCIASLKNGSNYIKHLQNGIKASVYSFQKGYYNIELGILYSQGFADKTKAINAFKEAYKQIKDYKKPRNWALAASELYNLGEYDLALEIAQYHSPNLVFSCYLAKKDYESAKKYMQNMNIKNSNLILSAARAHLLKITNSEKEALEAYNELLEYMDKNKERLNNYEECLADVKLIYEDFSEYEKKRIESYKNFVLSKKNK